MSINVENEDMLFYWRYVVHIDRATTNLNIPTQVSILWRTNYFFINMLLVFGRFIFIFIIPAIEVTA